METLSGRPRQSYRAIKGYGAGQFAIATMDDRIIRVTQPRGILSDHIEHRLDIGRRTGDHAQNLTRRRLLLQRLLKFLKEPHVFDGDSSLIGEGFEQLDLGQRKGANLGAACS